MSEDRHAARANRVRDGIAVALLVVAVLLPWSIEFGVGVPGSSAMVFVVVGIVTLLSIAAALAPYVGPWRLTAPKANARRTAAVRYWLNAPYLLLRARVSRVPPRADRARRRHR